MSNLNLSPMRRWIPSSAWISRLTVDPDATVGKYGKPWPEAWRRHLPRQVTLDDVAAAARASEQRLLADDAASGPFAVTAPVIDGAADPFA